MSSGRRTSVARPDQYTPSRSCMPTTPRASTNAATDDIGTRSPSARRPVAKATARWPASAGTVHRVLDELGDPEGAHPLGVLPVLAHGAEGRLGGGRVQLRLAEDA